MKRRNINAIDYSDYEMLTIEGQIIILLMNGDAAAGEICNFVKASHSTISRKLARMVDQGILECRISPTDRRMFIYSVSANHRSKLQSSQIVRASLPAESDGSAAQDPM